MIFLTGSSGFVGKHVSNFFKSENVINFNRKDFDFPATVKSVIHLAGKSQDLKTVSSVEEYYQINTELTKKIFDVFLASEAKVFIFLSSIKAVADFSDTFITEESSPNPISHYGKSKLMAEQYLFSQNIPTNKRVYILRPSLIHGEFNKGNLNTLYRVISRKIPWPFGSFINFRSYCSIDNLIFVLNELLDRPEIPSGVYNITDDEIISTNELIALIAHSQNRNPIIWNISKPFIKFLAKIGDFFKLPFNSEVLFKLTSSFLISNCKLKSVIGKPFPLSTRNGLIKTFNSFVDL